MAKKIAAVLTDGYEDSEFREPYERMKQEGFEVHTIGAEGGREVVGKRGKDRVRLDKGITDVKAEQFDALFIPGGYSPDHLRGDSRFVDLARAFMDTNKPVFAICHGAQLLMSAERVKGRKLTAWSTVQHDLKLAGAQVTDEPVVIDRNLLTSRKVQDIPQFNDALVKLLKTAK